MTEFILRSKGALKIPNQLAFLIADDIHLGWGEYSNSNIIINTGVILPLRLCI